MTQYPLLLSMNRKCGKMHVNWSAKELNRVLNSFTSRLAFGVGSQESSLKRKMPAESLSGRSFEASVNLIDIRLQSHQVAALISSTAPSRQGQTRQNMVHACQALRTPQITALIPN